MRAIIMTSLAFATLAAASSVAPADADSSIMALRDTEGLPTGRFPAMNHVGCVVPYCFHNPDGSIDHRTSTEALEKSQDYRNR